MPRARARFNSAFTLQWYSKKTKIGFDIKHPCVKKHFSIFSAFGSYTILAATKVYD